MAKTIMIGNEIYHRLKRMKRDRSFTEVIKSLLEKSQIKRGNGLKACMGSLEKDDHEYDDVLSESKEGFKRWTKKYA